MPIKCLKVRKETHLKHTWTFKLSHVPGQGHTFARFDL